MIERIPIAHGGPGGAQTAFDAAVERAWPPGARPERVRVKEDLPLTRRPPARFGKKSRRRTPGSPQPALRAGRRPAPNGVELNCAILSGHQVKAIVDFAREHVFDLLAIGYTGHSGACDRLRGGTSRNPT